MGDRGNIVMQYEEGHRIYFYAHWRGSQIPDLLQTALKKRWRWDDPAYLARIIFCELVPANYQHEETGFGISPTICDNEHHLFVVDCPTNRVIEETEDGRQLRSWSFEEFCALNMDQFTEYREEEEEETESA